MALVVPNPTVPTNGQALDASPLLANLNAVYQAIQAFDGSQIVAGSVAAAAFNAAINPNTLMNETTFPFIQTGLVWSTVSGLNGTMTSGVLYFNGIRVSVLSVASNAFAANKDTYIDIDVNGNITYQAVTTNTASPAITANSIRVGICVAGASITSFNQGLESAVTPIISSVALSVNDSLGNLIYPRDPNRKLLGLRQIISQFTGTATSSTQVTGLSCPVIVPVGRKIKISVVATYHSSSANIPVSEIWDGTVGSGTQLKQVNGIVGGGAASPPPSMDVVLTPTTSNKTYNLGYRLSGAGTYTLDCGGVSPAQFKVELD